MADVDDLSETELHAIMLGDGLDALDDVELERLAVRCRAAYAVVPPRLWNRLHEDSRARLERMSQTAARRVLSDEAGAL